MIGRNNAMRKHRNMPLLALLLCAASVVFAACSARPGQSAGEWAEPELSEALETAVHEAVLVHNGGLYGGGFPTEAHVVLALEETEGETAVWLQALYLELDWDGDRLMETGGSRTPTRLRFRGTELTEYWEPRGGANLEKELQENLPPGITPALAESSDFVQRLTQACYAQGAEHFGIDTDALCERLFREVLAAEGEELREKIHSAEVTYRQLKYLGDYAVRWAMGRFLADETKIGYSSEEKLEKELLWQLLQVLAGGTTEKYEPGLYQATGQHCWAAWFRDCERTEEEQGLAWMEENAPYEALALKLSRGLE